MPMPTRPSAPRNGAGTTKRVPLDQALAENWWQSEAGGDLSPERSFDRAWAVAVMDRAVHRLRAEHEGTEKATLFAELAPRFTGGCDDGLAEVGRRLGLSEGAVKMALSRLRRRYADALRAEVAETVGSRGDVAEELRYLLALFS